MRIDSQLRPATLAPRLADVFAHAATKIRSIDRSWEPSAGAPVFTIGGRYTSRGWTEWTQGFQFGSALLVYDATGDEGLLQVGRQRTLDVMAPHLTHQGVHDHGFNTVSTYGNLLRLAGEGRFAASEWERRYYELALKSSGAVQAMRWTATSDGGGYIYSFNGPHSLFVDTVRTVRALGDESADRCGHDLCDAVDAR